jgi:sRNA-binding carbon storage regulator CsrA
MGLTLKFKPGDSVRVGDRCEIRVEDVRRPVVRLRVRIDNTEFSLVLHEEGSIAPVEGVQIKVCRLRGDGFQRVHLYFDAPRDVQVERGREQAKKRTDRVLPNKGCPVS